MKRRVRRNQTGQERAMKYLVANMLAVLLLVAPTVQGAEPVAAPAAAEAPFAEGEVRKVDKSAGKVTIKHGPLENLAMPPMTMVFRVKDAAWLDQMRPGDRIRFVAEKVNGAFTVVRYEPMQ
jgi:Cu/Ag efflux protein CusF